MLPIYSYVNDQLGPLSGFVSFQPLMSIPGQHGIISSPRTVQSRKFQRGVSVIAGQTLQAEKKKRQAPVIVPAITIGCSLTSLLLKKPVRLILSHLSS